MVKISVVIPVYNVAPYLSQCLDSVLGQTFQDTEVLCVNDCSTDGSLELLQQYAAQNKRIKIFSNAQNIGAALSRNVGLDNAIGEYVYFVDSDDWLEPNYLEVMLGTIEKVQTDIVLNMNILQETPQGGTPLELGPQLKFDDCGEFFDRYNMIANTPCLLWARFYKRDFLNKQNLRIPDTQKTCEDLIFHYISHIWSEKSFVFKGAAYHYRIRQESITGQAKSAKYWDTHFIAAYDVIYDYYKEQGFLENLPIPIFHIMSCFNIDNAEKFVIYQDYLKKTKSYFDAHPDVYNELVRYVAEIVCKAKDFDDFKAHHITSLAVDFLRHRK